MYIHVLSIRLNGFAPARPQCSAFIYIVIIIHTASNAIWINSGYNAKDQDADAAKEFIKTVFISVNQVHHYVCISWEHGKLVDVAYCQYYSPYGTASNAIWSIFRL